MDMIFQEPGRPRRGQEEKMNLHHFRFDIFNTVIDLLINELNDRFSERSTELLYQLLFIKRGKIVTWIKTCNT